MRHIMMWIFYYGWIASSSAQEPRNKTCVGNYELSFFYELKTFTQAKAACEAYAGGSYLVKVDSAEITNAINSVIKVGNDGFFIGARGTYNPKFPGDGTKRIWKWLDGSMIYLPSEQGYQNWKDGQPNDYGGQEDCMILGKRTTQWLDTFCGGGSPHQPNKFICQRYAPLSIMINSSISDAKECTVIAGACVAEVDWRRADVTVSNSSYHTVYQKSSPDSSILHHENATIRDAGEYVCVAWIGSYRSNHYVLDAVNLTVNGTPTIIEIKSFTCNTSLLVAWRPHFRTVGFYHKILVHVLLTGIQVREVVISSTEAVQYNTEIREMQPMTEHIVQISPCIKKDQCLYDLAANKTTTALGNIMTVSSARLQQPNEGDICIVSWRWPYIIDNEFQITVYSSPVTNPGVNISESVLVNLNESGFIYLIYPSPGQVYDVAIQVPGNDKYCSKPVRTVGSCVGKDTENIIHPQTNISAIVIPVVVVIMLLIITYAVCLIVKKRNTKSTSTATIPMSQNTTERNDIQEYATVGEAYCSISDLQQSSSDTVNTRYENLEPDAKSPYTYEN